MKKTEADLAMNDDAVAPALPSRRRTCPDRISSDIQPAIGTLDVAIAQDRHSFREAYAAVRPSNILPIAASL